MSMLQKSARTISTKTFLFERAALVRSRLCTINSCRRKFSTIKTIPFSSAAATARPILDSPAAVQVRPLEDFLDSQLSWERKVDLVLSNKKALTQAHFRPVLELMSAICSSGNQKAFEAARNVFERCLHIDSPMQLKDGWRILLQGTTKLKVTDDSDRHPHDMAYELLEQMKTLHKENPAHHQAPTQQQYNSVLYACVKSIEIFEKNPQRYQDASAKTMEAAETLLMSLEADSPNPGAVQPTTDMYNNVILAHSNRAGSTYGAATAAEDWLMRLSERATEGASAQPSVETFNRVLRAWGESQERQGASRAHEILQLMKDLGIENKSVLPDPVSFSTVISAFAKRKQPQESEDILEEAVTYFSSVRRDQVATDLTQCWNTACWSWANTGLPDAPEKIEALLKAIGNVDGRYISIQSDTARHAACCAAYMRSGRSSAMEDGENHIKRMVEAYLNDPKRNTSPTTKEFESIIHGWYQRPKKYERNDTQLSSREKAKVRPIGFSATRATALLQLMMELSETRKIVRCRPGMNSFNMCIDLWCRTSKACTEESMSSKNLSLQQAEKDELLEKSHRAVERAESLLKVAERAGLTSVFSYTAVINALCRLGVSKYTLLAAEVLERMVKQRKGQGLTWPENSAEMYTTVLGALTRTASTEAGQIALKLLREMQALNNRTVLPTTTVYTSTMNSLSKVGQGSGDIIVQIFEELKTLDADPSSEIKLDVVAFERTLCALESSRDSASAIHACKVLTLMLELHLSGRENIEPTALCFNHCVRALTRLNDASHISAAADLIEIAVKKHDHKLLKQLPSPSSFFAVAHACKKHGMTQRANNIASMAESLARIARQSNAEISKTIN